MEIVYNRKPKTKVNRLSDIIYKVGFVDAEDAGIAVPTYPWELTFFTDSRHSVVCSNKAGQLINCHSDGEHVYCTIPAGTFPEGVLRIKSVVHVPDIRFQDGTQEIANVTETEFAFADPQKSKFVENFEAHVYAVSVNMFLVSEDGRSILTEDGQIVDLNLSY